jgi:glycosyltransferase involved in cell wall biosynthesis
MKRARRIISVSEQTRRDLQRLVDIDPARVDVVYPGLNYPFSPDDSRRAPFRERFGLPSTPIILHVGHTGFYKNIEGCLRVLAVLRRGGLDATFVRVGRRLTAAQLELSERLGVRESVRELGMLSPDDLADAYRAADVLLFPSLYEGFGWPPLEAMASGLPVVTSRSGSLDEVVADAALTAEPEDVDRLTDHVAAVLTDTQLGGKLRRLGIGRASVFDWRATASRVAGIYREVVES